MIILDTDLLTIVQRAEGDAYTRLAARLDAAGEPVWVTMVSFEEQMRGWLAYAARARDPEAVIQGYARLRAVLEDFQTRPILDFDDRASAEFERLRRARVRIGTMDLRIAAIALVRDALLLSRNLSDYRQVPGLGVEDWAAEP
jgi:tRNA(fMet)-specific endonuclease VapC